MRLDELISLLDEWTAGGGGGGGGGGGEDLRSC